MDFYCTPTKAGCWSSLRWGSQVFGPANSGTIRLRQSLGAEWNTFDTNSSCTLLHHQVVHETGHAFGIGRGKALGTHPINREHSIMSENDHNSYCKPQAYDIVALMALYQSR